MEFEVSPRAGERRNGVEDLSLEGCVEELGCGGLHLKKVPGFVSYFSNFQSPYHEIEPQIPPCSHSSCRESECGLGLLGPKRKYFVLEGLRSLWS